MKVSKVTVGMSGASVERHHRTAGPDWFVKRTGRTWDNGAAAEADRLRWLAATPLARRAPRVVRASTTASEEKLITEALRGRDGTDVMAEPGADIVGLSVALGLALRETHEVLSVGDCPFDASLPVRLAAARRRIQDGRVDNPARDRTGHRWWGGPPNRISDPAARLEWLDAHRPEREDFVVTHGDWCVPNIGFDGPPLSGRWWMVDVPTLGVACRWHDLAVGSRSVEGNMGPAASAAFLAGYGVEPDLDLLDYYVALDELA